MMQSLTRLTLFLCCAWVATLLYGEMLAYWVPSVWACSWPQPHSRSSSRTFNKPNPDNQVNIVVLADPQLMDRTSLGLAPKSLAQEAAQFYTDLYMRRAFLASILPFQPDIILFLGDQFDGGPFLSDQEWQESSSRFKHIFDLKERGRSSEIPIHFLSGNHDIGYASLHSLYPKVVDRYESEFGTRNYRFTVQKVDFVAVDAQTLDGPMQGNLTSLSWNFIQNVSRDFTSNPRVLLTHIPLYRPDETPCGPYRSSPIINQRVSRGGPNQGITYQNYLSEETSTRLLELLKPMLVLSGHDHDQCTVTHSSSVGPVTEHTLGTLSWQQGNLFPSFMLLSVTAPGSSNTSDQGHAIFTHLCFLPMQTHIYIWYLSLLVMTLLLLMFWPTGGFGCWDRCAHLVECIGHNFTVTSSKEKDEDEDCEYEMIWDAEGSMHLVKKAAPRTPVASSNDIGWTGRSNVVARPAAKKHVPSETEASIAVEMSSTDVRPETRSSKFNVRRVIQRLIRVFRLLVIIAVVNVPLYMMLLFKDWIER